MLTQEITEGTSEECTGEVRFLLKGTFEKTLQQHWKITTFEQSGTFTIPMGIHFEWRDVPIVEEE